MDIEALIEFTQRIVRQQSFSGEEGLATQIVVDEMKALGLDKDNEFVQLALKGLCASGLDPKLGAYHFCTNAAYSMGAAGVPTIGFGPGAEGDAHVVDEQLSLDELAKTAKGHVGIIEAVLGKA